MKMHKTKLTIFLTVLSLTLFGMAGVASAATYYVDNNYPGASDSNSGTDETHPWMNIGKAAQVMVAGDTVFVKNGTYYQTRTDSSRYRPIINPANSGTSGSPITFKVYPGHTVVITYASGVTGSGPLVGTYGKNYIIWDGFIIQEVAANNAQDTGPVVLWASDHAIFRNCEVRGVVPTLNPYSENHNSVRIENSTNAIVENNKLHGIKGTFHNHAAIMFYDTRNIIIQNNEIYDSFTAIYVKGPHGSSKNPEDPLAGNANITIRYNLMHDVDLGIRTSYTINSVAYQNIIRNSRESGLVIAESSMNVDFYNNIFYNVPKGVSVYVYQLQRNIDIRNNIFSTVEQPMYITTGAEATFGSNYNLYNGFTSFRKTAQSITFDQWKASTGYDTDSITSDPLFVDISDLHLQAISPAINVGPDFGDLDNDTDTIEKITIGAYVTGTETIGLPSGTSDITPPSAPTGLAVS